MFLNMSKLFLFDCNSSMVLIGPGFLLPHKVLHCAKNRNQTRAISSQLFSRLSSCYFKSLLRGLLETSKLLYYGTS